MSKKKNKNKGHKKNKKSSVDIQDMFARGFKMHNEGKIVEASEIYEKVVSRNPKHSDALHLLGITCLQRKMFKEAVEKFQKAIVINPGFSDSYGNLGNAYAALGMGEKAIEAYEAALELDPASVPVLFQLAGVYGVKGFLDDAEKIYERILNLSPQNIQVYNNLGNLYTNNRDFEKASGTFEKGLTINPQDVVLQFNLANTYKKMGEFEKSIELYKKIISSGKLDERVNYNLANTYKLSGMLEEAEREYKNCIEKNPLYVNAWYNLGMIMSEGNKLEEGIRFIKKAIELNPSNPEYYLNLGNVYEKNQDYDSMYENYSRILDLDPQNTLYRQLFVNSLKYVALNRISTIKKDVLRCYKFEDVSLKEAVSIAELLLINDKNLFDLILVLRDGTYDEFKNYLINKDFFKYVTDSFFLKTISLRQNTKEYLEILLTGVRRFLLESSMNNVLKFEDEILKLLVAMCFQCSHNEYIFSIEESEQEMIRDLKERLVNLEEEDYLEKLLLLSCYEKIIDLKNIDEITEKYENEMKNGKYGDVFKTLVFDYFEEERLKSEIKILKRVEDKNSIDVKSQYEENPYPRYNMIKINKLMDVADVINGLFPWNREKISIEKPEILIAGCGTGSQIFGVKSRFRNARILGFDLSFSSISYGMRKLREENIHDVEFIQGDILDLDELGRKFDIVECSGVLHHMSEPLTGLKKILSCLKKRGYLNLALYSEIARKNIVHMREKFIEKQYSSDIEGLRKARRDIKALPASDENRSILKTSDFYSASECRDLLFHVCEHRFNLLELEKIFIEHELEFMGFEITDKRWYSIYNKKFPEDKKMNDLKNWNQLEKENPKIFLNMYQMWLRKK